MLLHKDNSGTASLSDLLEGLSEAGIEFIVVGGLAAHEDLVSSSVEVVFRGYTVRVLSLKTIIELKQDAKDLKDISRLPILEETLRQKTTVTDS